MKKYILFGLSLCLTITVSAQEQSFKNGFRFSRNLINNNQDSLFQMKDTTVTVLKEIGYLQNSGEKIMSRSDSTYTIYMYKRKFGRRAKLKGIIKEINEDSLFIKFFPFTKDPAKDSAGYVNSRNEKSDFVLKMNRWHTSIWKNQYKDIPYKSFQITAANFPLRVNLSDGTLETGFTNVAVSISRVHGQARIYKSEFMKPRFRSWGHGGIIGIGSRKDINDKEELSINYGVSFIASIYGVKFLVAAGVENGFKSTSKKASGFIGFGFGLDIYELVSPEIKKKGE